MTETVDVPAVASNHGLLAAWLADVLASQAAPVQAPGVPTPAAEPDPAAQRATPSAPLPTNAAQASTVAREATPAEPPRAAPDPGAATTTPVAAAATPSLAPDTQLTPAQVSSLQGQPMPPAAGAPQRPTRPALPADERVPPRREALRDEREAAQDSSTSDDDDGDELGTLAPPHPSHQPDDGSALHRRLVRLLQSGAPAAGLHELALTRRLLLAAPWPTTRPGHELALHLLWTDARGIGRARRYRARGAVAASGWQQWRLHRDVDAHGQPLLATGGSVHGDSPPRLAVRLAGVVLPAPPQTAGHAWLDVIDTRRLLHDLGLQWSVLLLWAPDPP